MRKIKLYKAKQIQDELERDKGLAGLLFNINAVSQNSVENVILQAERRLISCFEECRSYDRREGNAALDILEGLQRYNESKGKKDRRICLPVGTAARNVVRLDGGGNLSYWDGKSVYSLALSQALNGVSSSGYRIDYHAYDETTRFPQRKVTKCIKFDDKSLDELAKHFVKIRDAGNIKWAHMKVGHIIVLAYSTQGKVIRAEEGQVHIYAGELPGILVSPRPVEIDNLFTYMESSNGRYTRREEAQKLLKAEVRNI